MKQFKSGFTLSLISGPCDQIIADDVTDCTFLRDFNDGVVQQQLAEMQDPDLANLSMAQLLADFFEFYGNFDYNRHAVCVVTGKLQPRRRKTPHIRNVSYFVDITNPLEPSLNVSANVQEFAVQKFRRICNLSLRKMWEIQELQVSKYSIRKKLRMLILIYFRNRLLQSHRRLTRS